MRNYELVLVLSPDLTPQLIKTEISKIKKLVEGFGGKSKEVVEWGKKEFAYPIKKKLNGFYLFWELELPPGDVGEIEKNLKAQETILRFLLIRKGGKDGKVIK